MHDAYPSHELIVPSAAPYPTPSPYHRAGYWNYSIPTQVYYLQSLATLPNVEVR